MKGAKKSSINAPHIAKLSRLPLKEGEKGKFTKQLANVMNYFGQIEKVDTTSIQSRGQVTIEENRFREDEVTLDRMLTQKEALGQARKTHNGFFVVPAIFNKA